MQATVMQQKEQEKKLQKEGNVYEKKSSFTSCPGTFNLHGIIRADFQCKAETPKLNATFVELYYLPDGYKNNIIYDSSHLREFAFRVKGTKKKVSCWRIEGKGADYFSVTKKGLVTVQWDIPYTEKCARAVLKAVLKDGTVLEAGLKAYSEDNIYIDRLFGEFEETHIKHSMSEKEKVEKAAWYIGNISSYDAKESSWKSIFFKGKGDCVASRYALAYVCQYVGIKAQACGNLGCHGETLVQADGDFYVVVTGYNEPKPRHYMVYYVHKDKIDKIMEVNWIFLLIDRNYIFGS